MVIRTQRGSVLPEGAVKLTKEEAVDLQKEFIRNWPVDSEVFSLKYGRHLCGAATAICGTIAFSYFRKVFKVPYALGLISYGPAIVIPTVTSFLTTDKILTNNTLLMKMSCPLCTQLKFTAFQLYNSVLSPILFSFLFCHYYGNHPKSFETTGPPFRAKGFWKDAWKLSEKGIPRFKFILIFQLGFSFLFPYLQNKQLLDIIEKYEQNTYIEELNDDVFV